MPSPFLYVRHNNVIARSACATWQSVIQNKKPSDANFLGNCSLGFVVFSHLELNGIQNEAV